MQRNVPQGPSAVRCTVCASQSVVSCQFTLFLPTFTLIVVLLRTCTPFFTSVVGSCSRAHVSIGQTLCGKDSRSGSFRKVWRSLSAGDNPVLLPIISHWSRCAGTDASTPRLGGLEGCFRSRDGGEAQVGDVDALARDRPHWNRHGQWMKIGNPQRRRAQRSSVPQSAATDAPICP